MTNREHPFGGSYGYCPKCGEATVETFTGVETPLGTCRKGHKYPLAQATKEPDPTPISEAQNTTAVGDNPILADVAAMHTQGLDQVRARVAQVKQQVEPHNTYRVMSVSIISAGERAEDQMIVFSPGGGSLRNATQLAERLKASVNQIEQLIENGAFKN